MWPLEKHPQFDTHNFVLLCFTIILRFSFLLYKEHWFVCIEWKKKKAILLILFLPWCKRPNTQSIHTTLLQIFYKSGGTICFIFLIRRWRFCGTAVITESKRRRPDGSIRLSLVKRGRASERGGLNSRSAWWSCDGPGVRLKHCSLDLDLSG